LRNLLEWGGVLPPPHAARAVDSADLAASIAVAAAVGHALCPWVGIEIRVVGGRGAGHGRRNGEARRRGRHPLLVHGGAAEVVGVVADLVGDNGHRVGSVGFTSKRLNLGQGGVRGQARWLAGEHGGFSLLAQSLLLGEGLLFPAHLPS
jgi:hypothetical protein